MPDIIEYENTYNKQYSDVLFDNLNMDHKEFVSLIEKLIPDFDIVLSEEQLKEVLPRYLNNNSVINTIGDVTINDIEKIIIKHFVR